MGRMLLGVLSATLGLDVVGLTGGAWPAEAAAVAEQADRPAPELGAQRDVPPPIASIASAFVPSLLADRWLGPVRTSLNGQGDTVPPPSPGSMGAFSESLFKFKTTIEDDGKGEAGGWQQATATLNFIHPNNVPKQAWTCSVELGLPIRCKRWGKLSAKYAAYVAATSATEATSILVKRSNQWPTGLFCAQLGPEMMKYIKKEVPELGQRVVTQ